MLELYNIQIAGLNFHPKPYPESISLELADRKILSLVVVKKTSSSGLEPLYLPDTSKVIACIVSSDKSVDSNTQVGALKNLSQKIADGAVTNDLLTNHPNYNHIQTVGYYKVFPRHVDELMQIAADIPKNMCALEQLVNKINRLENFSQQEVKNFYSQNAVNDITDEFKEKRLRVSDKIITGPKEFPRPIQPYTIFKKMFDSKLQVKPKDLILKDIIIKSTNIFRNNLKFQENLIDEIEATTQQQDIIQIITNYNLHRESLKQLGNQLELTPQEHDYIAIFCNLSELKIENLSINQLKQKEDYLIQQKNTYNDIIKNYHNECGNTLELLDSKVDIQNEDAKSKIIDEISKDYDIEWLKLNDDNYTQQSIAGIDWLLLLVKNNINAYKEGAKFINKFSIDKKKEIDDLPQVQSRLNDLLQNEIEKELQPPLKKARISIVQEEEIIEIEHAAEPGVKQQQDESFSSDSSFEEFQIKALTVFSNQDENTPHSNTSQKLISPVDKLNAKNISEEPSNISATLVPFKKRKNYTPLFNIEQSDSEPEITHAKQSTDLEISVNKNIRIFDDFSKIKDLLPQEFMQKIGVRRDKFDLIAKIITNTYKLRSGPKHTISVENKLLLFIKYYKNKISLNKLSKLNNLPRRSVADIRRSLLKILMDYYNITENKLIEILLIDHLEFEDNSKVSSEKSIKDIQIENAFLGSTNIEDISDEDFKKKMSIDKKIFNDIVDFVKERTASFEGELHNIKYKLSTQSKVIIFIKKYRLSISEIQIKCQLSKIQINKIVEDLVILINGEFTFPKVKKYPSLSIEDEITITRNNPKEKLPTTDATLNNHNDKLKELIHHKGPLQFKMLKNLTPAEFKKFVGIDTETFCKIVFLINQNDKIGFNHSSLNANDQVLFAIWHYKNEAPFLATFEKYVLAYDAMRRICTRVQKLIKEYFDVEVSSSGNIELKEKKLIENIKNNYFHSDDINKIKYELNKERVDKFRKVKDLTPYDFMLCTGVERPMFNEMVELLKKGYTLKDYKFTLGPENDLLLILHIYRDRYDKFINLVDPENANRSVLVSKIKSKVLNILKDRFQFPDYRLNNIGNIPIIDLAGVW